MAAPSPNYEPRTLVLCFDGTGNSFDDENTNVVRLFSVLDKHRTDKQLCYYQPGIGTYLGAEASVWSPLTQRVAKLLDEGFAWYLDAHILGGYRFLMDNYTKGDRICLFGFSRGAYTARCLAGMLHKIGLLPKSNEEQIAFAFKKYKDTTDHGKTVAKQFKATFSRVVEIEFIGVWETVSSVGIVNKNLPFTASNTIVKTFRQALALDEHRAFFRPNPWHRPAKSKEDAKDDPNQGTAVHSGTGVTKKQTPLEHAEDVIEDGINKLVRKRGAIPPVRSTTQFSEDSEAVDDEGEEDDYPGRKQTDVREVWFAGCHADVGGGSVNNNVTNSLANPSLMWMINQIIKTKPGILFVPESFANIPAFGTLTVTLTDPTPRLRGRIPSTFLLLRGAHGQETSEATVADHIILPPTPSTSGFTGTSSMKKVGFVEEPASEIPEHPPSMPPTPSTGGFVQPAEPKRTMTVTESGTTVRAVPPGPKPQFSIMSDEGEAVVEVFQDDPEKDARAKNYDELVEKKGWWILEYLWFYQHWQDACGKWHRGFYRNKGLPRTIESTAPLFHSSVQMRQKLIKDWKWNAVLLPGVKPTFVDDDDNVWAEHEHEHESTS